ncbi:MAG: hypothetical protein WAN89_04970 [Lawsonella sp.]|nr:hypothetical protein [Mycobacteriales bacterium]
MAKKFSRRERVKDPGRRRQGTRQRLEMGMGLFGAIALFAFAMVVLGGFQSGGSGILPSVIIFIVAGIVFIILAIKWRKLG